MAKVSPWHSVKQSDKPVYHDNTDCNEGNNIEKENRRPGMDGRPRCDTCNGLA